MEEEPTIEAYDIMETGGQQVTEVDVKALPEIDYLETEIGNITTEKHFDERGKAHIVGLKICGETVSNSSRFMLSLGAIFGFSPSIFTYFSPEEVFLRIQEKAQNTKLRVALQNNIYAGAKHSKAALACSKPDKSLVDIASIQNICLTVPTNMVDYDREGSILSYHPLKNPFTFDINDETFTGACMMRTPIDGYGQPCVYAVLVRERCMNALAAVHEAWRSKILIGKDPEPTTRRVIESYSNEAGFLALKERIEHAQYSYASLNDLITVGRVIDGFDDGMFTDDYRAICGVESKVEWVTDEKTGLTTQVCTNNIRKVILEQLQQLSGDMRVLYGIANVDQISPKKARSLPTNCRVYQLMNFATEIATHKVTTWASNALFECVGKLLAEDFDLEDSAVDFQKFEAFFDPQAQALAEARKSKFQFGQRVLKGIKATA